VQGRAPDSVRLPPLGRDVYVREVHLEFRLLLTYHSPILVQHLDRACPGWEAPATEPTSVSKTEQVRPGLGREGV
jgi:hypothetical protein